ncbi:MAG: hypothetical protein F9K16_14565 [Thermoanaerobaculia bacterium]|nr:MAG: hypothetical protein F9K16_14565 [Thermoanaerobaculia bacterium]MBZ0102513.1 hypothetical protein [Thermoanaerobaculia bacterium]
MEEVSDRGARRVWIVVGLLVGALILWRLAPRWQQRLGPAPGAARVAVQVDGEPVASDGRHEMAAGTPFRLHAVLEARTLTGETVWYTEAPALRLDGRDIPAGRLRRWPEERRLRVRWLTVEGASAFVEVGADPQASPIRLVENYQPAWGSDWSTVGIVDPRLVLVEPGLGLRPLPFGTQRYAVRLERYDSAEALAPAERWSSPGAAEALAAPASVTTVVAVLDGALDSVSRTVGAAQVEPAGGAPAEAALAVATGTAAPFVFTAPRLFAGHLTAAGRTVDELAFETVILGPQGPRWGSEAAAGDLLRAGARLVILWRDADGGGRLDGDDLVFDPHRGMRLTHVAGVFAGDGELRLELARLAP